MKKIIIISFLLLIILPSLCLSVDNNKTNIPIKYIWRSGIFIGVLVSKDTTDKQLESLIYKFREAKKFHYLQNIVPAITLGPNKDQYAPISILVFSDPKWATLDQNNKYIHTRGPDIIARSYLNHIRASYEYSLIESKEESGAIGYDEGGLRSVHYKELF